MSDKYFTIYKKEKPSIEDTKTKVTIKGVDVTEHVANITFNNTIILKLGEKK